MTVDELFAFLQQIRSAHPDCGAREIILTDCQEPLESITIPDPTMPPEVMVAFGP